MVNGGSLPIPQRGSYTVPPDSSNLSSGPTRLRAIRTSTDLQLGGAAVGRLQAYAPTSKLFPRVTAAFLPPAVFGRAGWPEPSRSAARSILGWVKKTKHWEAPTAPGAENRPEPKTQAWARRQ